MSDVQTDPSRRSTTAQFGDALARGRPLVIDRPDSAGACAYRRLTEELDRAELPLTAVA